MSKELEELSDSISSDVVNSLDIPDTFEPKTKTELPDEEEEVQEEEASEEAEEEDEPAPADEEEEEQEEAEEDVIPKSQHEKVIKKMEARIARMTAEQKELEAKASTKKEGHDDRIEAMSKEQLQAAKNDIRLALLEGSRDGEELSRQDKLNLMDLEDKVSTALNTFQQRREGRQIKALERIVPEIEQVFPDFTKQWQNRNGDLYNLGIQLYQRTQSFKDSEVGLAEAFALAMDHLTNGKNVGSQGKDRNLKRDVNQLKRKVALSGRSMKPDMSKESKKKSWKKAVEGGDDDKASWVYDNILPQINV